MDTEIIDNEMKLTGRISPVQYSQEVQKLDIAVPVVAGACHCALVNGQGGQQGLRPVPDILKLSPGRSARSHGFVRRLSAKGLHPGLFSHTSCNCGLILSAASTLCTVTCETPPMCSANSRVLQWVAPSGGRHASVAIFSRVSGP